ncbi:MAG: peptide chain release factor 1 [Thermodesulfovibrionales bacterium]|nr:peptide chain release factor 1 [Thermodesulfovibrionales bacterium]
MLKKIIELERRYQELMEKLMDPAVIGDQREFQKFGREQSELAPVMERAAEYKRIAGEVEDARELAESADDPEMKELAQAELDELEPQLPALEQELKVMLLPKDKSDHKNVILEIRAGTGGDEAGLFAADLFRMYSKFAESRNWKVETMESSPTGVGGIKEVMATVSGKDVFRILKYESGVHRVQRVPNTETQGRIHTSAATVAVLPEAEEVDLKIDESDLRVDTYCASGPGGQGVNTTYSAVRIVHEPTGLMVQCQDGRSQIKNKEKAMKVLRARLYELEREKQDQERADQRKGQVGSGDRSERIRTYNFPQNRVTDHRAGITLHKLEKVMEGEMDELLDGVHEHFQREQLKDV